MKILSVDFGDVRTGLAISDESEFLASPVEVVRQTNAEKLADYIAEKAKQLNAGAIVVGYPKNMDGSAGERAQKCAAFADMLNQKTGLETALWDERCTTVSAYVFMNYTDTRGKKRKNTVDAAAACIILQDYLDFRRAKRC